MTEQAKKIDFTGWDLDKLFNGFYHLLNNRFDVDYNKSDDIGYMLNQVGHPFNKSFPGLIHFAPFIDDQNDPFPIYRAVPHCKLPMKVKDGSYNPKPDIQRCNFKGQQVFYAGDTIEGTVRETEIRMYDKFLLGTWIFDHRQTNVFSGIFNVTDDNKKSYVDYTYAQMLKYFDRDYTEPSHNVLVKHLYKTQTQLTVSSNHIISAYVAHNFLYYEDDKIPFNRRWMLYPSMKTYQRDYCLAFPKTLVDTGKVKPVEFKYVMRVPKGLFCISEGKVNPNGEDIDWI